MHILPNPQRTLAIPLAALALGAAGGTTAALIIADSDTVVVYGSSRAAEVRALPSTSAPVPERVSPAPTVSKSVTKTVAPVPERVSPSPVAETSSPSTSAPVPERISGAHAR